jgi:putative membrane protein
MVQAKDKATNLEQKQQSTIDSKYIQQHLANERTYLAWVRTCITIMGVGFLITNLHFSTLATKVMMGDILARIIGLSSIIVGIVALIITTNTYFIKGKQINNQTFKFSRLMILYLSVSLILIFLVFGLYYLYVWGLL